ncbi:MAG: hypothetical protein O3A51_02400, partial [Verrucomicrobia bacterium]|nr:hypothetical protein [Verrucomicrobiota bacterium]
MSDKNTLQAGFAEVDISPPLGTQIAGDIGRPRPTETIREPIFARAAVFEQGGTKLGVLVLDVLTIGHDWVDRIRAQAAEQFGFDKQAIMVHATQTHSAPSVGNHFCRDDNPIIPPEFPWLRGGTPAYWPVVLERSVQAIGLAVAARQPVTLSVTRGVEARVAFNRRFVMRDGTTDTHAHRGRDNVVYVEGPTDPEVCILKASAADGTPVGMLLHYTCHPTYGYPKRFISPDWPGFWVQHMKDFT